MTRSLGAIVLDDNVNTFMDRQGIDVPSTMDRQYVRHETRHGRVTQISEDDTPLKIPIYGLWCDSPGKYWEDFRAAMLSQRKVALTMGDGTRFEMVDCTDCTGKRTISTGMGSPTRQQNVQYVAQVQSYEPFAREVGPLLNNLGGLNTGNGTFTTSISVNYGGTVFGEPTWQISLIVQAGVTVTAVSIQNTITGEVCNVQNLSLTNGTFYVLLDASGTIQPTTGPPPSPNNNAYGVLAQSTIGYGVTLVTPGPVKVDQDFIGRVPTLSQSDPPTIPPTACNNPISVTVTANGILTSASLQVIAPQRYRR